MLPGVKLLDKQPPRMEGNRMSAEPSAPDIESRAAFYQEFLAEREEIMRNKWFRSQENGADIGWEAALLDWVKNHRSAWKKARERSRRAE